MSIGIFVQALRIVAVAAKRVELVESAVGLVIIAGAEVLLLELGVELLAAVEHVGAAGGSDVGRLSHLDAVGVEVEAVGDCAGGTRQEAGAAVTVVEEVADNAVDTLGENVISKGVGLHWSCANAVELLEDLGVAGRVVGVHQEAAVVVGRRAVDGLDAVGADTDTARVIDVAGGDVDGVAGLGALDGGRGQAVLQVVEVVVDAFGSRF